MFFFFFLRKKSIGVLVFESSEMCQKHTSCLDLQIKVTAWLILH